MRVGLIGNSEKVSCAGAVKRAAQLIAEAGRKVFSDPVTAELAGIKAKVCAEASMVSREVDLLLVFGGDGTMLRVAREIAGSRTPMLGINIGGLGFLTAVPSEELPWALKNVWAGEFSFESRVLLRAGARRDGKEIERRALNDIVIS